MDPSRQLSATLPGTVGPVITPDQSIAIVIAVQQRFPLIEKCRLSLQGSRPQRWCFMWQKSGARGWLEYPITINQQELIAKLDSQLLKAGLQVERRHA